VRVEGLRKVYSLGDSQVIALAGIDLEIRAGEFVAVMGPSGSGKSTFMQITGLLDNPTSGQYFFEGTDVSHLDGDARADIRSRRLGFVFQAYNLLSRTSAQENVELPMVYAGVPIFSCAHRAREDGHRRRRTSGGTSPQSNVGRAATACRHRAFAGE
jgi:putative ABC transport system ATP-binding protein